jgi:glyoxylase-like metal-dependent hydrolase (beta-lactamase superfamily II)
MKKIIKRTLIVTGLILIPAVAFLGIRIYKTVRDIRAMTPVGTGEITGGVFAVKDSYVNLYLVRTGARFIAFDSGADTSRVRSEMKKLGIDPSDVSAVFLTHADSDHTGGVPLFRNAAVYLSTEEEQMVDGRKARFFIFKNKLDRKHVLLKDNETVAADSVRVTAILTPGHTPGSTCYLVDGKWLFTGDSMSLKAGKAGIFSRTINMDNEGQVESLKKLARLGGVQMVFTAHFGVTDAFDRAFESFQDK